MTTTGFLQLDDRNRAQLGKYLPEAASVDYRVEVADDGVITLSPARVIADHELRLLEQRPDLVALMRRVAEGGEMPAEAMPRRRPIVTSA